LRPHVVRPRAGALRHVAISHATPDEIPEVNDVERVFDEATTPAHVRSRAGQRRRVVLLRGRRPHQL